jgi:short-subunit dehydrogenase
MNDFAERYGPWAIVAGASDGTGEAFAEELAARGLNVVLVARREEVLRSVAARLAMESRVVVLDLSLPDAGAKLAAATEDLDVGLLVYNAGADPHNLPILDQPIDDLRALVQRNCLTVLDTCHRIGARLVARGRGGVILVSSAAGWVGASGLVAYGATKAFDLVLAEGLWAEWRPHGVDAVALVLGAVDTPSLRRLLEQRGGTGYDQMAQPVDVVREGLDHLRDGPTWQIGLPDPVGPSPFGALPRREASELQSELAGAMLSTTESEPGPT